MEIITHLFDHAAKGQNQEVFENCKEIVDIKNAAKNKSTGNFKKTMGKNQLALQEMLKPKDQKSEMVTIINKFPQIRDVLRKIMLYVDEKQTQESIINNNANYDSVKKIVQYIFENFNKN